MKTSDTRLDGIFGASVRMEACGTMRILVAKNKKDCGSIFQALREWGYEVKVVRTPSECREVLTAAEFDMAFLGVGPDEDLPLNLCAIREKHPYLPIIGLTNLSRNKLDRFLNTQGISRADFISLLHPPFRLEDLVFIIEEVIARCEEETIEEEKPLTKKERQERLDARRRPAENQRLSDFLSTHGQEDVFGA